MFCLATIHLMNLIRGSLIGMVIRGNADLKAIIPKLYDVTVFKRVFDDPPAIEICPRFTTEVGDNRLVKIGDDLGVMGADAMPFDDQLIILCVADLQQAG